MRDHKEAAGRSAVLAELRGGWMTLAGASWGIAVGAASLPFYTSGVFAPELRAAFGWTLRQISLSQFASTLTVALFAPVAGLLIDRYGVLRPAVFGLVALALSFAAFGSMSGNFSGYLLISITMALFALPSGPVSFTRAINGKFDAGRGLALGIALSGTGVAAVFAPPVIAAIIAQWGWRSAYFCLAGVVMVSLPFIMSLLKARPASTTRLAAAPGEPLGTQSHSIASLLRDGRFRRLFAAFFLQALGVCGFVLHLVSMLGEAGMTLSDAAMIQGQMGVAIVVGRLLVGASVDRYFAPHVAALVLVVAIAGVLGFAVMGSVMAIPMALALGFALGAEVDLIGYLTVRYFGLSGYGRIYGLLYSGFALATGLSPVVIAQLQLFRHDYGPALWASAAFMTGAMLLLATAPRFPQKPAPGSAGDAGNRLPEP